MKQLFTIFQEDGFVSFRVHELAIGSLDPERRSLSRHRMLRLLAPQVQENPIFFHMTNYSSEAVRGVVDQLAEVGYGARFSQQDVRLLTINS